MKQFTILYVYLKFEIKMLIKNFDKSGKNYLILQKE